MQQHEKHRWDVRIHHFFKNTIQQSPFPLVSAGFRWREPQKKGNVTPDQIRGARDKHGDLPSEVVCRRCCRKPDALPGPEERVQSRPRESKTGERG